MDRNQIILDTADKVLKAEIEDLVELSELEDWEEPETPESALDHFEALAEEHGDKATLKKCLKVRIALGDYIEISDEDARTAVRNGMGVKMKDFPRLNGKRYEFFRNITKGVDIPPRV